MYQVRPGALLADRYRVERIVATDGMGFVVACRHVDLDEMVALKFLLPERMGLDGIVERFVREASAAAQIKSEHVVRVRDVGRLEDGSPFMVMEYLEGRDLKQRLDAEGPLPVSEAVDYLRQACEARAEAHSIGIVHRDFKPANLFLAERAGGRITVKILDFGISKVAPWEESSPGLTTAASMLGTPHYMSPEQMESARDVDARSDIWALGVVLYEVLSASFPFAGDTLPIVCARAPCRGDGRQA